MRKARMCFAAVLSAYLLRVGKGFLSPENVYLEPFSSAKFTEIIPENSIMESHFSPLCTGFLLLSLAVHSKCGSDACELCLAAVGEGEVNLLWVPPVG